jgi:xanthine dehydrogenase molybdopterin-binding subunit B
MVEIDSPCTPERIFFAIEKARARVATAATLPAGAARS